MEDRIKRLEQLARLLEKGAITREEFDAEKRVVLSINVASDRTDAASGYEEPTEAHSSNGSKAAFRFVLIGAALAATILALASYGFFIAVVIGLLGLGLQAYANATDDLGLKRFAQIGYGAAALALAINLGSDMLLGGRDEQDLSIETDDGDLATIGDGFADAGSFSSSSEMSCRTAMGVAAVATCGIRLNEWLASNSLGAIDRDQLRNRTEGYHRSLDEARSVSDCSGPVGDGERSAQMAIGEVDYEDVLNDIEGATQMCVMLAREDMDELCEIRPECN